MLLWGNLPATWLLRARTLRRRCEAREDEGHQFLGSVLTPGWRRSGLDARQGVPSDRSALSQHQVAGTDGAEHAPHHLVTGESGVAVRQRIQVQGGDLDGLLQHMLLALAVDV